MLGPYSMKEMKGRIALLQNSQSKTIGNWDQLAHYLEPMERSPKKLKKAAGSPLVHASPPRSSRQNDCASMPDTGAISLARGEHSINESRIKQF